MKRINPPTPAQVKAARLSAGLTQEQAAAVVHRTRRSTWADWESERGTMDAGLFELFLIKTGQKRVRPKIELREMLKKESAYDS